MKTRSTLIALWAIVALFLAGCGVFSTTADDTATPDSTEAVAQGGPGAEASIIPDEVTLDQLLAKCEDIAEDPDYLPDLPGVTADGLGGKALAAKDDDLETVRRGVANGMLEDFVNGGAVARAYVAEADRAYTLGDLRPTKNANFEKMIEALADEMTASEVCDRVATLYAGALEGEYQTIAPGTVFAGLVYSNDYSSLGYVCDLMSPPEGVRVLSWTRPVSAEFTGDQSETLDTIKVAIGYRMLVVDKCPVSEEEAADFSGSLLDEPEPEPEETETGGSGDAAAGAGQGAVGGSGDAAAGAGGSGGNDAGACGASCGTGGGGGDVAVGGDGHDVGGGDECAGGSCDGGETTPSQPETPTEPEPETPTEPEPETPTEPEPETPTEPCVGVYPVPQHCKPLDGSEPPAGGEEDTGAGNLT